MAALSIETFRGEYAILQAMLPGRPAANIGVLLLDPAEGTLRFKLRDRWDGLADDPGDAEVLNELGGDFARRIRETGGPAFLAWLEDTASNVLQLTPRTLLMLRDFDRELERLYARHVEDAGPALIPYRNCLPLISMAVAAGLLDRQVVIEETGAHWLRVPESQRPNRRKFVARIAGRSMEPMIPDGSLAIFRFDVHGSRGGKILLVELFDQADPIARYTVKKYSSVKRRNDDGTWEHEAIDLLPLNPEYPAIQVQAESQFRVVAEFTGLLEAAEN